PLAGSSLPGDRLDISRRIPRRRSADASGFRSGRRPDGATDGPLQPGPDHRQSGAVRRGAWDLDDGIGGPDSGRSLRLCERCFHSRADERSGAPGIPSVARLPADSAPLVRPGCPRQWSLVMSTFLLLASGGGGDMSIFDPASPPAESIFDLSMLVVAITGLIF